MKTIGLIGGTTWASTLDYYRIINETIRENLGKQHSAHLILYSVDFENFIYKNRKNWDEIAKIYIQIAKKLQQAGADFLIICANTIHKIADQIQKNINIPIIHITDVTAEEIIKKGIKKVGLLGTKITMQENFYKKILKDKYNIKAIIPDDNDVEIINDIIFNELSFEIIKNSSKKQYLGIIDKLVSKGAEGIILGCTEIPILIKENDVNIPIFNTTLIHARAAAKYALG